MKTLITYRIQNVGLVFTTYTYNGRIYNNLAQLLSDIKDENPEQFIKLFQNDIYPKDVQIHNFCYTPEAISASYSVTTMRKIKDDPSFHEDLKALGVTKIEQHANVYIEPAPVFLNPQDGRDYLKQHAMSYHPEATIVPVEEPVTETIQMLLNLTNVNDQLDFREEPEDFKFEALQKRPNEINYKTNEKLIEKILDLFFAPSDVLSAQTKNIYYKRNPETKELSRISDAYFFKTRADIEQQIQQDILAAVEELAMGNRNITLPTYPYVKDIIHIKEKNLTAGMLTTGRQRLHLVYTRQNGEYIFGLEMISEDIKTFCRFKNIPNRLMSPTMFQFDQEPDDICNEIKAWCKNEGINIRHVAIHKKIQEFLSNVFFAEIDITDVAELLSYESGKYIRIATLELPGTDNSHWIWCAKQEKNGAVHLMIGKQTPI